MPEERRHGGAAAARGKSACLLIAVLKLGSDRHIAVLADVLCVVYVL